MMAEKSFRDYGHEERRNYITLSSGEFYPDILEQACLLYEPVLQSFRRMLEISASSTELFMNIAAERSSWMRVQLCRVFKRYVSPETPVELLKKKTQAERICRDFGRDFRAIPVVQAKFDSRPLPDEALCALLWEYKDRGKKGYDLTERFFDLFQSLFSTESEFVIWGPKRAGQDVQAKSIWPDYPNDSRPLDFVISNKDKSRIYAVGLARYDGDRGGAQEDDRTGGYKNCADEVLAYADSQGLPVKILFVNDGPGLLLGTMWEDYSRIEERDPKRIKVLTLRMIPERLTEDWLTSGMENA